MKIYKTYLVNRIHSVLFTVLVVLFSTLSYQLSAQNIDKDSLFVLDARLVTSDSLLPVPEAHIISKRKLWGNISNDDGRFMMYVDPHDTLMISSIGFATKLFIITDSVRNMETPVPITLEKDTVLINEVIIRAFWDYEVFKQMIIDMPPMNLDQFYPDMDENPLMYYNPTVAFAVVHPIQALYDMFNRSARLQRKLIKNRREYNKIMIQMGRPQDTIPAIPEHMRATPQKQKQKHYLEIPGVGHKPR